KEQGSFFSESLYAEKGYTLKLESIGLVDGIEAYVMSVTTPDGDEVTEYYAVESGLKIKEEASQEGPQGPMTVSTTYSDYRKVGNIMAPYSMVILQGPQKINFTFQKIEVNTGLSRKDFE
ncbi:MAG: insulinase family protein, partial [Croceimicrobium sp.]